MKQHYVCFSVVTYRHNIEFLLPLLNSFVSLYDETHDSPFKLRIMFHENICASPLLNHSLLFTHLPGLEVDYHSSDNIGFGSAHNHNFSYINSSDYLNTLFVVCNPDISFNGPSLLDLFTWVIRNPHISVAAPLIFNSNNSVQYTVKRNPTFLSLFLGRFDWFRSTSFFQGYFNNHTYAHFDYTKTIISSTYLSGCFLIIPSVYYNLVNGFDSRYFLHLEDADISRSLAIHGSSVHIPIASVMHDWARGSHYSFRQMYHVLRSYIVYIYKWGFSFY